MPASRSNPGSRERNGSPHMQHEFTPGGALMKHSAARSRGHDTPDRRRGIRLSAALAIAALAAAGALHARDTRQGVDEADPLVGTAPLDRQDLIGNAPPPGEPLYSGQTSPGARLPHSATEAAPVNVN